MVTAVHGHLQHQRHHQCVFGFLGENKMSNEGEKGKCGFAELHKFYVGIQGSEESYTHWTTRLRGLAADCEFSDLQEKNLDKFVMGMRSGQECDTLFAENIKELTLTKAVDLAESIGCTRTGAVAAPTKNERFSLPHDTVVKINSNSAAADTGAGTSTRVHREADRYEAGGTSDARGAHGQCYSEGRGTSGRFFSRYSFDAGLSRANEECFTCGGTNHPFSFCRFRTHACRKCKVRGHLAKMCSNAGDGNMHHIREGKSERRR
ncbi:hypothetical protein EVAR_69813_1 [Eumeta japonica]|uniref:CCHC-type domain-containing protein n=1 Tax=Eumeta variegata TaxID=151549 RepID=A0A4C1Z1I0_EUMVA|nr:hypothetical protein EVAR_69813_1 [Eumeta japonica]